MTTAAGSQAGTAGVTADITYAIDTGEKLVNETFGPGNIHRRSSGSYEARAMPIRDGRAHAGVFSLDTTGFELAAHPTAMTDFFDKDALQSIYYPEAVALVKAISGAKRVEVFDHTLRSGNESEREAKLLREPVLAAHNDYTEWSGPQRLREFLPDEAEALLQRRFAIIQVWRAIDRPIVANPLALADARSVAFSDLIVSERRYPHRVGQTYRLRHNRAHQWFYFPQMHRDEALVFKVFDSDGGRARFTPHTSFEDPATPADAPPRHSIEVRTLAFF